MPQRNVASNFTFEQQRVEINNLAQDFWTQKGTVDTAASTYLKHDGSNDFTGQTLAVPAAFTINSNSGNGTVTISGNLDVTGTTTTVSSANLEVTDKNILIAKGSTSDSQADGAGITIDSATDITFNFVDNQDALVSSIGLEGTTFLKAPYGQFTGSGTATGGQGVEINAPDANTGQIISYDRGGSAYKELRLKGSSVGIYTGTTNALIGTFNSTGLTTTGDITLNSTDKKLYLSSDSDQYITANAASNYMMFAAANQERLRIDSNGNVNIGLEKSVAFPSGGGLQVYHSGNPRIKLTNDTTGNTATDGTQIYLSNDGDTIIDNKDGEDIIFHTNAVEKFRIKSTATGSFLGIGNSTTNNSIAATLQVIAADGEADELYVAKFQNLEATAGRSYGVDIRAGSNSTDHGFRVKNRANDTTQFLIRGDGHIESVVNTTSTGTYFKNGNTTDGFGTRIEGGGTTADRYSLVVFNAAGEESFRVNANKRVGIGNAQPTRLLHVEDTDTSNGNDVATFINDDTTNGYGVNITAGGTATGRYSLRVANGASTEVFKVKADGFAELTGAADVRLTLGSSGTAGTNDANWIRGQNASLYFNAASNMHLWEIGGAEHMRLQTDKLMTKVDIKPDADGTLDLGASGARWANVYTSDIDLNNQAKGGNTIDGSWGSYLIEEGVDDLFLKNRRTGKTYKFMLTEVS